MRADDQDHEPGLEISRSRLSFLGPEFLTWLYFHLDMQGGSAQLSIADTQSGKGLTSAEIIVGNRVTIKHLALKEMCVTVASPMLDDSGEVLQAVQSGGLIYVLALQAHVEDRKYDFTLNANDGALSQVKIHEAFSEEQDEYVEGEKEGAVKLSEEETFFLRIAAIEELEAIVDGIYEQFLQARLAPAYAYETLNSLRNHVIAGLQAKLPTVNKQSSSPDMQVSQGYE